MSAVLDDILAKLKAADPADARIAKQEAFEITKDMPWVPNPGPQTEAYWCEADELLYGGEAGGGKTDLLLGLALTSHQ